MKYDSLINNLSEKIKKLELELQKTKLRCSELEDEVAALRFNVVPTYPIVLEEADFDSDIIRWVS